MMKSQLARLDALRRVQKFLDDNAATLGTVSKSTSRTDLDCSLNRSPRSSNVRELLVPSRRRLPTPRMGEPILHGIGAAISRTGKITGFHSRTTALDKLDTTGTHPSLSTPLDSIDRIRVPIIARWLKEHGLL
jgi:hypothetical protein